MLNKNSFIRNFDAKLHYYLHYSLLKVKDNDGIYINDSVQSKKCNHSLGRWNFIIANEDYSCGIYHALESIRQSIFSALENNKNNVNLALASKSDSDGCYVFDYEKKFENQVAEQLKKTKVVTADHKNNGNCECCKKISKKVFFKVIKPVLEEMFKNQNLILS